LRAFARVVQPTYLTTLGVPLLQGRGILPTDNAASEPVAVISAAAAARYWPDGSPLGSSISLAPDQGAPWVRVVGVVGDVEATSLGEGPAPVVYTPFEQSVFGHFGDWGMDFLIRTAEEPHSLAGAVRAAVAEVDPTLPIFAVGTLEDRIRDQLQAPRALGLLMGVFAAVALFLSTLGIYGTLAYGVARSVPEIGVRMALGAHGASVVRGVLRRGFALAGSGLVVGLLLSAAGGRWVEGMLFGVESVDPTTYAAIALALLAAALLASGLPAWRASRIDPAEALRRE
jgi:predicted permease